MADEAIVNVLNTLSKNISNSNDKLDSLTAMLKSQFTNLFASQLNFANNVSSSITKSKGTFGMATNKKAGPSIDTAAIISGMSSEITSSLDKLNETLEKNHLKILKEDEKRDKDREDNRKEDKQDEKKRVTGLNKDRGKTEKAQFKKSDGKYDDLIRKVLPTYGQKSGSAKFEQAVQSGKSRLAAVNIPQIQEKLNTTGTNLQKKGAAFERLQNLKSKGQAGLLGSGKTKRATGLSKVAGGLGGKFGGLLGKFLPMIGKFLPLISKALGPIGMLLPVILKVVGILDKFRDAIGFIITGGIAALGVAIFTVKAAIEKYLGPVIDAFKLVRKILIDSVIVALKAVGKSLMWLGETVWNVLKAPIMLLVDGLKLLGAGVKFVGEVAWEMLKGTISAIVDSFKWLGQTIWSGITSIASLPGKLLGFVTDIGGSLLSIPGKLLGFVADIGSNLLSLPGKLWNWMFGGGDESTSITDTIYNIVDSLYQLPVKLLGFVTDMGVSLLQVPAKLFQFVTSMGKEVLSIPGKLVEFVSSIGKELLAIPSKIFEWIFGKSENQSGIAKTLMQIAETILNIPGFIYEAATDALKFIVDIPAKIFDFVTGLQTQLLLIPSKLLQFISSIGQSIVSIPGRIFRWLFGGESSANEADGFISSLIKSIGSTLFELPGKLLSFVTNIGSSLLEVPKIIFNAIASVGTQLLEVPKMLFGFVTDLGKNIMAIPGKIFSWLFGGGDDNEEEVSNESGTIMKEAVQVVADALLSLPSKLLGFITEIGTSLLSIPAKIFQSINQMVMNIGATILSLPGKIFSWLFGDEAAANVSGFLKDVINQVAQALIEFPGKIVGFIKDLGAQLLEVPKMLFGFVTDLGKNIMAIPGKIFSWLFGGGNDNEEEVSNESGTIMKEAVQVVADALLSLPGKLLTFITEIGTSLLSIPAKIFQSINQMVMDIGTTILSLPGKIFSWLFGDEAAANATGFLKDVINQVAQALIEFPGKIVSFIKDLGAQLLEVPKLLFGFISDLGKNIMAIPGKIFSWLFGGGNDNEDNEEGVSNDSGTIMKDAVQVVADALLSLPGKLLTFITEIGTSLLSIPNKILESVTQVVTQVGEQVLSLPRKIFDMIFGTEGLELFGEGGFITNVIEEIGNTLRAIPGKLFNWLFGAEDGMSPSEVIKETVINIGNDLLELPNRLGEFITQSGNKLLAFATELPGKIWDMAKSALSKLNPLKNLWPFGGDDEESVQDTSPLPIPEDRVKRVKTNEQLDELARIKQERIERLNALKFGNENPPLSPVNAPMPNTINGRELSPTDFPSGVINRNTPPSIKLESDEKLNKTLIDNNSQTNKLNQNMELLIDTIDKKDLSTKVYNNNQSAPVRKYSGGRHVRY